MSRKLLFLGAPGVGKGTFAKRIAPALGIVHISAGDCLRENIRLGTVVGNQVHDYMSRGELVPGGLVVDMMKSKVNELRKWGDTYKGYLLDGFPRILDQALLWKTEGDGDPDIVINLTLNHDILLKKITSRRVCSTCGDNYNLADIRNGIYDMPPMLPKLHGICNTCGGTLSQREDDCEDTVKHRLSIHSTNEGPLLDYYSTRIFTFEVTRGVSQTQDLLSLIKSKM